MNKSELMEAVFARRESGFSKCHVENAVNDALDIIKEQLVKGDKVSLPGFGKFETVTRKAKTGRNPQTGKPVEIPARQAVKFTPGKALKESVKG